MNKSSKQYHNMFQYDNDNKTGKTQDSVLCCQFSSKLVFNISLL